MKANVSMDTRHTYSKGYTYANMTPGGEPEEVEVCNRCGTTREIGNHFQDD